MQQNNVIFLLFGILYFCYPRNAKCSQLYISLREPKYLWHRSQSSGTLFHAISVRICNAHAGIFLSSEFLKSAMAFQLTSKEMSSKWIIRPSYIMIIISGPRELAFQLRYGMFHESNLQYCFVVFIRFHNYLPQSNEWVNPRICVLLNGDGIYKHRDDTCIDSFIETLLRFAKYSDYNAGFVRIDHPFLCYFHQMNQMSSVSWIGKILKHTVLFYPCVSWHGESRAILGTIGYLVSMQNSSFFFQNSIFKQ